jgi:hypothetical protein
MQTNKPAKKTDLWDRVEPVLRLFLSTILEILHGIWFGKLPLRKLLIASVLLYFTVYFHLDHWILKIAHLSFIYPSKQKLFEFYYLCLTFSPFLIWGLKETINRKIIVYINIRSIMFLTICGEKDCYFRIICPIY